MRLRIKEHLAQAGMKQTQLAEALDVTPGFVSNLISGKRQPSPRTLEQIATTLGVRVADLIDEPGGMSDPAVFFTTAPASEARALCRAMHIDARSPAICQITKDGPALATCAGDHALVDLNPNTPPDDLALATITDPDGTAETILCRIAAPWLITGNANEPPIRQGNNVSIMAKVLLIYRKTD